MIRVTVLVHFKSGKTTTVGNVTCSDGGIAVAIAAAKRRFPKERKIAHQVFPSDGAIAAAVARICGLFPDERKIAHQAF